MDLASKILEVLSEAMDLEKGALKKACGELNQKILTNFYPKCSNSDLELGLPRHTDPGTITILLQATSHSLYIYLISVSKISKFYSRIDWYFRWKVLYK